MLAQPTLLTSRLRWARGRALGRTRGLLEKGNPIEEVVRVLRAEGFQMIESMSALIKAGGVSFDDARTAVIDSPTQRRVTTRSRWSAQQPAVLAPEYDV
jgi:hypothetical protein